MALQRRTLLRQQSDFRVTRDGIDITDYPLSGGLQTGIQNGIEIEEGVPLFEEYSAMIYARFNEAEWRLIDPLDRAKAVAHYRLSRLVEHHEQSVVQEASKRRKAAD